jgi:hypothetical protein
VGDGILGVRDATAAFQALGLACGLLAARRAVRRPLALAAVGLLLAAWSFPRYKAFEPAMAMMAVYVALLLCERPTPRMHLAAGVFCGLAAFVGTNHALYGSLGILTLALFLLWKGGAEDAARKLGAWAAGVLLGLLPSLSMFAHRGYLGAFVHSLQERMVNGPNEPSPYLWPWRVAATDLPWYSGLGVGAAFLVPPLAYALGLGIAARSRRADLPRRSLLLACTFVGVFYSHHAAVRSDGAHLAQSIHPALLALVALPAALGRPRRRAPAALGWGLFGALMLAAVWELHPHLIHLPHAGPRFPLVEHDVAGERLRLLAPHADYLTRVERSVRASVPEEASLFLAPSRPTLYPLLGKVAPCRSLYFFFPRVSEEEQRGTIRSLEERRTEWALIVDVPIAGKDALRFSSSNPLVWRWLGEGFERVPTPDLPANHLLLRRRAAAR